MIDGVEPHDLVKQMGLGYNQDLNTKVVNYGKFQRPFRPSPNGPA
jgi:iron(III) transport system substrate-binding protein